MRALWLVLAVVACEKAAETRLTPPVGDARAPIDARVRRDREDELEVRVEALDRLRQRIASTKRQRSPVEAPAELTNAYVDYQFAYGYAQLGRSDRARALVAAARRALAGDLADPVHGYLVAALEARIEQAIANTHFAAPLPEAVLARYAALDRTERYKADRFREVSWILSSIERPDPIGAFSKKLADARGLEVSAIRVIADPVARRRQIALLPELAVRAASSEKLVLLDSCLDLAPELAKPDGSSVVSRVRQLVATVPDAYRGALQAKLLVVAEYFGRAELISPLVVGVRDVAPFWGDAQPLFETLRLLRRTGKHSELTDLLASVEPAIAKQGLPVRLVWAGGIASDGDRKRAQVIFDEAHAALPTIANIHHQRRMVRAIAEGYASAPAELAIAGVERLTDGFAETTDGFSTNTHFALSVVDYVESLVLGLL